MKKCEKCQKEAFYQNAGQKCTCGGKIVDDHNLFNPGAGQVGFDLGLEPGIGLGGGVSMDFDGGLNVGGISLT